MSSFESTLARMQELYKYGRVNEEQERINNSIEHHATGSDGREYAIIRENNKFYIKSAPHGKSNILEAYDYINGFMRKKEYQYSSYPDALKNFQLKMKSLNEANDAVIELDNLDRFKRNDILKESADAEEMKNQLARVRQIMHNTAVIMKESTSFGKTPITNQPDAAKGNSGDTDTPYTEGSDAKDLNHELKTATDPTSQSTPFDKKACTSTTDSKINEDTAPESAFDAGLPNFPSGGTGTADTKQNNEPFTQTVAESCDEEDDVANAASELSDDDMVISDEPEFDDTAEDDDVEPEDLTDETPEDGEEIEGSEDDSDLDDDDFEGTEDGEEDDATSDLESRIAELEAKIAELQSQIDSTEIPVDSDEEGEIDSDDDDNEFEFSSDEDSVDLNESYDRKVNGIIDSVWKKHLNENELHVFGQHPGYRKKPMTLPATGSDKNEHGRDWNDESVHSEKPFGTQIGKSDPYNELVKRITNDVKNELKGMANESKKKK